MPLRSLSNLLLSGFLLLLICTYSAAADCGPGTIKLQTNERDLIKSYDDLMDQYRSNQNVTVTSLNEYFYRGKGKQKKSCISTADLQLLYKSAQSVFANESSDSNVKEFIKTIKDALEEENSTELVASSEKVVSKRNDKKDLVNDKGLNGQTQNVEATLDQKIDSINLKLNILIGLVLLLGGVTVFLLRQKVDQNREIKPISQEPRKPETVINVQPSPKQEEAVKEVTFSPVRPSNSFKTVSQPVDTVAQKTALQTSSTLKKEEQKPVSKTGLEDRQERNQKQNT